LALDLDPVDHRGVQREDALDSDAARDLSHCEGLPRASAPAGDHDTREDLDALFLTFADLDVDTDAVSRRKPGNIRLQHRFLDFQKGIGHCRLFNVSKPPLKTQLTSSGKNGGF